MPRDREEHEQHQEERGDVQHGVGRRKKLVENRCVLQGKRRQEHLTGERAGSEEHEAHVDRHTVVASAAGP